MDGDDDVAVEALARAFSAGHVVWMGGGGGLRTEPGAIFERAAFAARGMGGFDLALLLWCCGVDDRAIRSDVWAVLMLEGEEIARRELAMGRRSWPRGVLQALVEVALEELRPTCQRERWTGAERARRVAARLQWPLIDHRSWGRRWGRIYDLLLAAAARRECSARVALGGTAAARRAMN